jgi:hypothetical protein
VWTDVCISSEARYSVQKRDTQNLPWISQPSVFQGTKAHLIVSQLVLLFLPLLPETDLEKWTDVPQCLRTRQPSAREPEGPQCPVQPGSILQKDGGGGLAGPTELEPVWWRHQLSDPGSCMG